MSLVQQTVVNENNSQLAMLYSKSTKSCLKSYCNSKKDLSTATTCLHIDECQALPALHFFAPKMQTTLLYTENKKECVLCVCVCVMLV